MEQPSMIEKVQKLITNHIARLEKDEKNCWCKNKGYAEQTSHLYCVNFDAKQAETWTSVELLDFEDRCIWEEQVRAAKLYKTKPSTFWLKYPSLVAEQYTQRYPSVERLLEIRAMEDRASAQREVTVVTTKPIPTGPKNDRAMNRKPARHVKDNSGEFSSTSSPATGSNEGSSSSGSNFIVPEKRSKAIPIIRPP